MKKALLTSLTFLPLSVGVVAALAITGTIISNQSKSLPTLATSELINVTNNYQNIELKNEELQYFNGSLPLSHNQVKFINENNNGVGLNQIKEQIVKNQKVFVTEKVKSEIVDNYYQKAFFDPTNPETLNNEFYPQVAKALVVIGDLSSYVKANQKLVELWKNKEFIFPWEQKAQVLAPEQKIEPKAQAFPAPIANVNPLTPGQLKYFDNQFPLSPKQEKFINENNGEWSLAMIRQAVESNQPAYANKNVTDQIIGQYFKKHDLSIFKDSEKQVVWEDKAIDYPESVKTETTIRKRAEAIIKLWKEGGLKLPWEVGAQVVAPKVASAPPVVAPSPVDKPVVEAGAMEKITASKLKYLDGTYILTPELVKYINDNNDQQYADMQGKKNSEIFIKSEVFQKVLTDFQALFNPNRMNSRMKKLTLIYNGINTEMTADEIDIIIAAKTKNNTYWEVISTLAKAGTITLPWYKKA